jgi:DNA-binding Xre family transcriptional regulator
MLNPADINPLALPSVPLEDRRQLPTVPCIYFAIDSQGTVQYIGQTKNPRNRWAQHHRHDQLEEMGGVRIAYVHVDVDLLEPVEAALIDWFNPPLNGTLTPNVAPHGNIRCFLSRLMWQHGINQSELAKATGLMPSTISKLRQNRFNQIDVRAAEILCAHFRLTKLDDLFEVIWDNDELPTP